MYCSHIWSFLIDASIGPRIMAKDKNSNKVKDPAKDSAPTPFGMGEKMTSLPTTFSPNKRSFRGPGGVVGLALGGQAKTCARELASVTSRGLQGPHTTTTHHHPPPPTTTTYHHLPPPPSTTYHHPPLMFNDLPPLLPLLPLLWYFIHSLSLPYVIY